MTAAMVNLGLLGTVHDIVVSLCAQDRADAVAAVTASLLSLGEITIVTRVTNALVASSHSKEAATISGEQLNAPEWPNVYMQVQGEVQESFLLILICMVLSQQMQLTIDDFALVFSNTS